MCKFTKNAKSDFKQFYLCTTYVHIMLLLKMSMKKMKNIFVILFHCNVGMRLHAYNYLLWLRFSNIYFSFLSFNIFYRTISLLISLISHLAEQDHLVITSFYITKRQTIRMSVPSKQMTSEGWVDHFLPLCGAKQSGTAFSRKLTSIRSSDRTWCQPASTRPRPSF